MRTCMLPVSFLQSYFCSSLGELVGREAAASVVSGGLGDRGIGDERRRRLGRRTRAAAHERGHQQHES